jgi:hypothetical protein
MDRAFLYRWITSESSATLPRFLLSVSVCAVIQEVTGKLRLNTPKYMATTRDLSGLQPLVDWYRASFVNRSIVRSVATSSVGSRSSSGHY